MIKSITHNWFIYLILVAITLIVYSQMTDFQFVNYDDNIYITKNPHISEGLTISNVKWAFAGKYEANWMPLTWISFFIDHQSGANAYSTTEDPYPYHRTNLLLHIANALLLFLLLSLITGSRWRSAAAAAIFAVHPLHVESVAWVAERKDVLSTFFMMLTLLGYLWYTKKPGVARYGLMTLAFVLGLMSKSMLVTVPILLLLMDMWPLKRLSGWTGDKKIKGESLGKLTLEKLPLLAIAMAAGVVTVFAQERGEAVQSLSRYPMGVRLANAAVSYISYILKTFWPARLAATYPHPGHSIPVWQVVACTVALVAVTVAAIRVARRLPQVTMGWLWYVIALLPVIGIIQVGQQAMADRYTYVPMIGFSIAFIWGLAELVSLKNRNQVIAIATISAVAIVALMVTASAQTKHWANPLELFSYVLTVTKNNAIAEFNVADELQKEGRLDEAEVHFRNAIRIDPTDVKSRSNLAAIYAQRAIALGPGDPHAYVLGQQSFSRKEIDQAYEQMSYVVKAKGSARGQDAAEAHHNFGNILMMKGDIDGAIAEFKASMRCLPLPGTDRALAQAEAFKQAAQGVR